MLENNHENKKPFCLAPWVHAHVFNGDRKLCCVADHKTPGQNLIDYWNSDYLKNVRLRMLEDNPPEECRACFGENKILIDVRESFNKGYEDCTEELLRSTLDDGYLELKPRDVDYRIDNICNFSCRICSPTASSSIERLEEKAGLIKNGLSELQDVDEMLAEVFSLIKEGRLRSIYFAEGEPFISKNHWKIIKYIKELQQDSEISLRYNSNLSVFSYEGTLISDWLKGFKFILVNASMDGYGETSEFIRTGFVWSTWKKNFDLWREFIGENIVLAITLSTPTILDFKNLAEFVKKEQVSYRVNLCSANGLESLWSPLALDRDTLSKLIFQVEQYLANEDLSGFKACFAELKRKQLRSAEPDWYSSLLLYLKYYHAIDRFRRGEKSLDWIFSKTELKIWTSLIWREAYGELPKHLEKELPIDSSQSFLCLSAHTKSIHFLWLPLDLISTPQYVFDNAYKLEGLADRVDFSLDPSVLTIYNIGPSRSLFNQLIGGQRVREHTIFEQKLENGLKLGGYVLKTRKQSYFKIIPEKIVTKNVFVSELVRELLRTLGRVFPDFFNTQELTVSEYEKTEMGDKPDPVVDYHSSRP